MTDRELLERAAKAAGIRIASEPSYSKEYGIETYDGWSWNPLRIDGDALRLAVKLVMSVEISKHEDSTYAYAGEVPREYAWENWSADPYAATRRAIVRAAAEIGKEMP